MKNLDNKVAVSPSRPLNCSTAHGEETRSGEIWQIVSVDTSLPLAEGNLEDCIDGANLLRDQFQISCAVSKKK